MMNLSLIELNVLSVFLFFTESLQRSRLDIIPFYK